MAEQLGLRKIIDDTFHTLWWVPEGSPPDIVTGYLRALDRAEKALDADLDKYLPLWKLAVPAEFENAHAWDFSRFGRGERFVYETIPRSEFDEVMDQVKRWGLDDYLKDKQLRDFGGAKLGALGSIQVRGRHARKPGERMHTPLSVRTVSLPRRFVVAVALHRRAHQEAIAFLDDALDIVLLDMRMADDDIVLLAGVDHALHPFQHDLVLVLPRIAELLRQVAFADQDAADARHVLEHVVEILDAAGILDLQDAENLALRIERPDVGLLIIFLLAQAPIARRRGRTVAADAGRARRCAALLSRG